MAITSQARPLPHRREDHLPRAGAAKLSGPLRPDRVSAWAILDKASGRYRPLGELRQMCAPVMDAKRIITYRGGGIAASSLAFVLHRLGHPNVAVHDGGLLEWCADPSLPLELGDS